MTPTTLLEHALVYLVAAVVLVPLAARLGLGSVLGYLLAGVVIGPWCLGLVGEESSIVMQFAEFGVVMMLFLVGLELDPARLWQLRGPVMGLGSLQVAGTAATVLVAALVLGFPWQQGAALGLAVAMSSTAIGLQSLSEKGLSKSIAGQSSFSVLLFQDLAVIPILAIFPLLATLEVHGHGEAHGHGGGGLVEGLVAWQRTLVVLGAVGAVVLVGRLLVGPVLRIVARSGLREMFTATALLIVVAVSALMGAVGMSAALGTFLAGTVLANSEYRHELVADIEPFKGLLLGLFFVAVGASIDFGLLRDSPLNIGALVIAVIVAKLAVLWLVVMVGRMSTDQGLLFAAALGQVGEFAFVLLGVAEAGGVLPPSVTAPMVAVTAFSMAATPLLLTAVERWVLPRIGTKAAPARPADAIEERNPVIIAGFGRFGQIAGRMLLAHGIRVTVLDHDSEQVELLRKFGFRVYYGDATRLDLLHAAGAHDAKVLVVAMDDPDKVLELVHTAKRHFPHLAVLARARGRTEAYSLLDAGVDQPYRETFDASARVGTDVLRLLGMPNHAAQRAAAAFTAFDEASMRELGKHRDEGDAFYSRVRQRIQDFEKLLQQEGQEPARGLEGDWEGDALRKALSARRP